MYARPARYQIRGHLGSAKSQVPEKDVNPAGYDFLTYQELDCVISGMHLMMLVLFRYLTMLVLTCT